MRYRTWRVYVNIQQVTKTAAMNKNELGRQSFFVHGCRVFKFRTYLISPYSDSLDRHPDRYNNYYRKNE